MKKDPFESEFEEFKNTKADSALLSPQQIQDDWNIVLQESNQADIKTRQIAFRRQFIQVAAACIIVLGSALIWLQSPDRDYRVIKNHSKETIMAELPDGSAVSLHPGAKIKVPKNFGTDGRTVLLFGEAFFEVKSDPAHPFIVETGEAKVRVTGTSFLVSADKKAQEVAVEVHTGKVLFYTSETLSANAFRVGLYAGDKGTYIHKENRLNKTQIPTP